MHGISFKEKLRMAFGGMMGVLKQPKYLVLALLAMIVFAMIIFLSINWNFYGSLLLSSLPIDGKLETLWMMFTRMMADFTTPNGALLLLVSILQGINIALLAYTLKHNRRSNASTKANTSAAIGSGGFAAIAAALGLGCVPCGTSIILPIVSIFFSSSAYAAAEVVSGIVLVSAFVVSCYAIYKTGFVAFAYVESHKLEKE